MKKGQEKFLRGCLGNEGFEALQKTITREGFQVPFPMMEHYLAMMVVPHSLLSWVLATTKQLPEGGAAEFDVPGHEGTRLLLNKLKPDIYSGHLHRDGAVLQRFTNLSVPQLAGHIMTSLEMYDNLDPGVSGHETVVNALAPLIEKLVQERVRSQSPVKVVIHNHMAESKPSAPGFVTEPPVMKEEPRPDDKPTKMTKLPDGSGFFTATIGKQAVDPTAPAGTSAPPEPALSAMRSPTTISQKSEESAEDSSKPDLSKTEPSFRAGYHMVLGNFYRGQSNVEKAALHDQELEQNIQMAGGKYSEIERARFDEGAEAALLRLKKGKLDQEVASTEPTGVVPSVSESSTVSDVSVEIPMATVEEIIDRALKSMPKDKTFGATMTKSEMSARCPDCGGQEFVAERFVGCICMEPMRKSLVAVKKKSNGTYRLEFGKGWDAENIGLLLEIMRRKRRDA